MLDDNTLYSDEDVIPFPEKGDLFTSERYSHHNCTDPHRIGLNSMGIRQPALAAIAHFRLAPQIVVIIESGHEPILGFTVISWAKFMHFGPAPDVATSQI